MRPIWLLGLIVSLAWGCGDGGVNHPPLLSPLPDQTVDVGDTIRFTVHATDPDGDEVTLSPFLSEPAYSFDAGEFVWETGAGDGGTHFFGVTATDDGIPPLEDAMLVRLVVHDPLSDNHPPIWYGLPADGTASVGTPFEAVFQAVDPDGDSLTYVARLPEGAELVQSPPEIGAIHWTPTVDDVGEHQIPVFAIDDGSPSMSVGLVYRITVSL